MFQTIETSSLYSWRRCFTVVTAVSFNFFYGFTQHALIGYSLYGAANSSLQHDCCIELICIMRNLFFLLQLMPIAYAAPATKVVKNMQWGDDYEKNLLWCGMGWTFLYIKRKWGWFLILFKKCPPPNDFFAHHFSFFGHLLPTVSYGSKLCTDKFMGTMLLEIWQLLKKICSKRTIRAGDISNVVFKYQTSPSSGGIEY